LKALDSSGMRRAMRIARLALLLLLLQLAIAFAVEEELVVRGPVALMAAGPQTAHVNTTLASLVALDDELQNYCDLSHDSTARIFNRMKIKGSIVMVAYEDSPLPATSSCSMERAYLTLVEAGALAVLLHATVLWLGRPYLTKKIQSKQPRPSSPPSNSVSDTGKMGS
jgi:hypothetical protein